MKIILINSSIDNTLSYGVEDGRPKELNNAMGRDPPLGLCYIASVLRENGYNDVEIIDAQVENASIDQISKTVADKSPDLIGISILTFSFLYGAKLAQKIKELSDIPIVIGGFHVNFYPEEIISHDFFDVGVLGEGEYIFLEIVKLIEKNKKRNDDLLGGIGNIKGILYENGDNIYTTERKKPIKDLDSLPFPARDLLENEKYYLDYLPSPATSILTSRGCPFNCTFCSKTRWSRNWRSHSPEYIVNEMEHCIEEFGSQSFQFLDDTFTASKQRILKIVDLIEKRNIDTRLSCLSRVDTVDNELIKSLKNVGLNNISFGIESGDPFILDEIKKGTSVSQIKKAVRLCKKYDIKTTAYFMVGHPEETQESIENTLDLIEELNPDWFKANILSPYPGSELYENLIKEGKIEDYWQKMTKNLEPIKNPNISKNFSKEELKRIQNKINLKPYLRPGYILNGVRNGNPKQIYRTVKWVYHVLLKNL